MSTFVVDAKSGKASIVKDPNATLDYTFDWTSWLDAVGDSLASVGTTVVAVGSDPSSTVSVVSSYVSGKTVVAWVSGGVVNETITLTCHIKTNASPIARQEDSTVYLKVKEK